MSEEKPKPDLESLNSGQLKENLQNLEVELIEAENRVIMMKKMKSDNEILKGRIVRLKSAFYGLMYHASHPSDPELMKTEVSIYEADYQDFISRGKKPTAK